MKKKALAHTIRWLTKCAESTGTTTKPEPYGALPRDATISKDNKVYNRFNEHVGSIDEKGRFRSIHQDLDYPLRVTKRNEQGVPIQVWAPPENGIAKLHPFKSRGNRGLMFTRDNPDAKPGFGFDWWSFGDTGNRFPVVNPLTNLKLRTWVANESHLLDSGIPNIPVGVLMDTKGNVFDPDHRVIGTYKNQVYTPVKRK